MGGNRTMTQEDKNLLLKDLSTRLPYQVKVSVNGGKEPWTLKGIFEGEHTGMMLILEPSFPSKDVSPQTSNWQLSQCKPYLRPMSSMTEEEIYDLAAIMTQGLPHDIDAEQGYFKVTCKELIDGLDHDIEYDFYVRDVVDGIFGIKGYDWLNKNMFDYRGLIPKGLALSTEEFNPYKD